MGWKTALAGRTKLRMEGAAGTHGSYDAIRVGAIVIGEGEKAGEDIG